MLARECMSHTIGKCLVIDLPSAGRLTKSNPRTAVPERCADIDIFPTRSERRHTPCGCALMFRAFGRCERRRLLPSLETSEMIHSHIVSFKTACHEPDRFAPVLENAVELVRMLKASTATSACLAQDTARRRPSSPCSGQQEQFSQDCMRLKFQMPPAVLEE